MRAVITGVDVDTFAGGHVLVALGELGVEPSLEESVVDEHLEAVGEDVGRDADVAADLREVLGCNKSGRS